MTEVLLARGHVQSRLWPRVTLTPPLPPSFSFLFSATLEVLTSWRGPDDPFLTRLFAQGLAVMLFSLQPSPTPFFEPTAVFGALAALTFRGLVCRLPGLHWCRGLHRAYPLPFGCEITFSPDLRRWGNVPPVPWPCSFPRTPAPFRRPPPFLLSFLPTPPPKESF